MPDSGHGFNNCPVAVLFEEVTKTAFKPGNTEIMATAMAETAGMNSLSNAGRVVFFVMVLSSRSYNQF